MTQDEIIKAFNNRWRIKREANADVFDSVGSTYETLIRSICRDFFEAGLALGARDYVPLDKLDMAIEMPLTPEEAEMPPKCLIRESDILTVEDTFNKWWDLYDLKCGKENCMKKWKKLTAKEQFDCIKATPAYVASTPDKQFRKRPLTYLNQKAWNDEIIPRNGTDNKSTIEQQRKSKLTDILVG
jgi:hypothetical protein